MTARESTLGSRPPERRQFETPAPGDYNLDKIDKSKLKRGYTFGHPNPHYRPSRQPGNKIHTEIYFEIRIFSFLKLNSVMYCYLIEHYNTPLLFTYLLSNVDIC